MNHFTYRPFYRRHLPHIQPPGATLFVTFRLAGSLPMTVVWNLEVEARQITMVRSSLPTKAQQRLFSRIAHKWLFGKWDHALDNMEQGPLWLEEGRIAEIVVAALHFLDGRRYDLAAFCVMPNHVHVLLTPLQKPDESYFALSRIMHSLKRYTAREANKVLQRRGRFWQHESYDHYVRDANEQGRIIRYILNNPVKAGLVEHWEDWKWSNG